jgi:hypothetical protein
MLKIMISEKIKGDNSLKELYWNNNRKWYKFAQKKQRKENNTIEWLIVSYKWPSPSLDIN